MNVSSKKHGTKGRPSATYRINPSKVVTKEQTAILLLAMQEYPRPRSHEINREAFIKDMNTRYGFEEDFIKKRLNWATRVEYIYELSVGTISPDRRVITEQPFLERLAQAYE
jgi:hypothetical protein